MMRSYVWINILLALTFIPQGQSRKMMPFYCKYKPLNDFRDTDKELLSTLPTTTDGTRHATETLTSLEHSTGQMSYSTIDTDKELLSTLPTTTEGTKHATATLTSLEYSTGQISYSTTDREEEFLSTLSTASEGTRQTTATPTSLDHSTRQMSHYATDEKSSSSMSLTTTETKMQTTGSTHKDPTSLEHSTHQTSTSYSTADSTHSINGIKSTNVLIVEPPHWIPCPVNMEYTYCNVCEASCETLSTRTCTLPVCADRSGKACVCVQGFFRKGSICVPFDECGCYHQGEFLTVGEVRVNDNCSELCQCTRNVTPPSYDPEDSYDLAGSNFVVTCTAYNCAYGAECVVKNGIRQCYCTTSTGFYGDESECSVAYDCSDIFNAGYTYSGIYTITSVSMAGYYYDVYCNMKDEQGWTVILRRVDGAVDFNRNWTSYKEGFGELEHEFWYGNENLYLLTSHKTYLLQIDLTTKQGTFINITYDLFRIGGESNNYKLVYVGSYTGYAGGDVLSVNNEFSTYDRDNDEVVSLNCAADEMRGAWWYADCDTGAHYGLNGKYSNESLFSLVEMKVRPANTGIAIASK